MPPADKIPSPASPAVRRLTLLDVMILVAATGFGIAGGRVRVAHQIGTPNWWGESLLDGSVWLGVAWALTLFALRFRRPRPPWRRLTCRPGWMAGVAVLAAIELAMVDEIEFLLVVWAEHKPASAAPKWIFARIGDSLAWNTPYAVAGAWAALAIGGRWRPDRSGIDRMGRAVGLFWLGFGTLRWVVTYLPALLPGLKGD